MSVLSEICVSRRTVTTVEDDEDAVDEGDDVVIAPDTPTSPRSPQQSSSSASSSAAGGMRTIPVYVDTGWGADKCTGRSIPISRESLSSSRSRGSSFSSGFSEHSGSACPSPVPSGVPAPTPSGLSTPSSLSSPPGVLHSPRLGSSTPFRTLYGLQGQPGPLGQSLRNLQSRGGAGATGSLGRDGSLSSSSYQSSKGLRRGSSDGSRSSGEQTQHERLVGFHGSDNIANTSLGVGGSRHESDGGRETLVPRSLHSYQGSTNSSSSGVCSEDGSTPRAFTAVNRNSRDDDTRASISSSAPSSANAFGVSSSRLDDRHLPGRTDVNANFSSSSAANSHRADRGYTPSWVDRQKLGSRPTGQSSSTLGRLGGSSSEFEMRLDQFLDLSRNNGPAGMSGSRTLPSPRIMRRAGGSSSITTFRLSDRISSDGGGGGGSNDPVSIETQRLVEGLSRSLSEVPSPPRMTSPLTPSTSPSSPEVSRDANVPSPPGRSPWEGKFSPRDSTSSGGSFDSSGPSSPPWKFSSGIRGTSVESRDSSSTLTGSTGHYQAPPSYRTRPWSYSVRSEEGGGGSADRLGSSSNDNIRTSPRARASSLNLGGDVVGDNINNNNYSDSVFSSPESTLPSGKTPSPRLDVWNYGPKGMEHHPHHPPRESATRRSPPGLHHKSRISSLNRGILGLHPTTNGTPEKPEVPESLLRSESLGSASPGSSSTSAGEGGGSSSHRSSGSSAATSGSSRSGGGDSSRSSASVGSVGTGVTSADVMKLTSSNGESGDRVAVAMDREAGSTVGSGGGAEAGKDRFEMDLSLDLTWEQRKKRMTDALAWTLEALYGIRDTSGALLNVFQNIRDTIEAVKQERARMLEGGSEEDLEEEDEAHWEDWEITEFDKSVARGEDINYDQWEQRAHPPSDPASSPSPPPLPSTSPPPLPPTSPPPLPTTSPPPLPSTQPPALPPSSPSSPASLQNLEAKV